MGRYDVSLSLWGRAKQLIPCGAMTLSKAPERFPFGAHPIYAKRAYGSHLFDVDGHEYIDYFMALGPISLGYNYPAVRDAIVQQVYSGSVFSLEHQSVVELAELLVNTIPCVEAVRFVKDGSSACNAALRVARTYTGREVVLCHGYHGWGAEYQAIDGERGRTGVPAGLFESIFPFRYNDTSDLQRLFSEHAGQVAAVMLEPARTFEPEDGYLQTVKELCQKHGAVLIFDEVVTGFRWSLGGAQGYYGVTPDLATFGKGISNGMPLGVITGRKDIMQAFERCFVSGTYGGEVLSIAAALATIHVMRRNPVCEHMWKQGKKLREAFDNTMQEYKLPAKSVGVDVCSRQTFDSGDTQQDNLLTSLWLQETAKRGVLFATVQYLCYSHSDEDLKQTETATRGAAQVLRRALDSGEPERYLDGQAIAFGMPLPGATGR